MQRSNQTETAPPVPIITWFIWLSLLFISICLASWYAVGGWHKVEDIVNFFVYAGDAYTKSASSAEWAVMLGWAVLLGSPMWITVKIATLARGEQPSLHGR